MICLGRRHCPLHIILIKLNLSPLLVGEVHISEFIGEDAGAIELDAVFQGDATFRHC
jgi:hypothetical protein